MSGKGERQRCPFSLFKLVEGDSFLGEGNSGWGRAVIRLPPSPVRHPRSLSGSAAAFRDPFQAPTFLKVFLDKP